MMHYLIHRRAWSVGLLVVATFFCGCQGNPNVTVEGFVIRNGQPILLSKTGVLQITLMPDVAPDESYTNKISECDRETGKFQILDVKPGKYKIGVEQFDPNPQNDKLNSAFRADTGKIVREIDGKAPLVIDLAKPGAR